MTRKQNHSRLRPVQMHPRPDHYAPDALLAAPGFPNLFPKAITEKWRRQMGRFTNQPKGALVYPSNNGQFDPLSIAAVLDMLLRLEPGPIISAGGLHFHLEREYQQISWDTVTIGKILSDLNSVAEDLEMPTDRHEHPIYARKHGGARAYIIHNDPHGWQWLGLVREHFGKVAEQFTKDNDRTRNNEIWTPVLDFSYGDTVA